MKISFCSVHLYARQINQSNVWVCAQLSLSSSSGFLWWTSALQGGDQKVLNQYIKEEQSRSSTLNSSDIANTDPEAWLVAHTINNITHGHSSLSIKQCKQSIKLLPGRILKISPLEPWVTMLRFGMSSCDLPPDI